MRAGPFTFPGEEPTAPQGREAVYWELCSAGSLQGWKVASYSGPQSSGTDRGWGGEKGVSLLLPFIHCLHKYLFIIISAAFRFSLWMWLTLYSNVKGITTLVKILTTWGQLLRLLFPLQ